MNHICGCYWLNAHHVRQYLPQVELSSRTTITPVCFTTTLVQTFKNLYTSHKIEQARYTFPLYDGVSVSGYTIRYGDLTLDGIVQQKHKAKQTYDAAVSRGETAGLLESLPAGIFGVTIGNIPAGVDVVVEIIYCGEIKHDAGIDGLRYTLPTSIAPRYGAYPSAISSTAYAKGGIKIVVDIDMAGSAVRKIQSPSHPIAVTMGEVSTMNAATGSQPYQPHQASATLTLGTAELHGDFVLQVVTDSLSNPQAIIETHPTVPNQRAILTTLVPKFTLKQQLPEIVFIADQSGSMSGTKNRALVSALKVFIKSLPLGTRVNICAFGSNYRYLYETSQPYSEAFVDEANKFVNTFVAQYGGTEMLEPVKEAFKRHLKGIPLEIMLLTDGEIWGESELFSFINSQILDEKVDARIFGLGIGNDVSHTLVEGVARAGNGFAQFVTDTEDTDAKVIRMLKGALYGHTTDYSLDVQFADTEKMQSDDEDFEIVEKVTNRIRELSAGSTAPQSAITEPSATISFFDSSADTDKPIETSTTDRYAHLPKLDVPKILQAPTVIPPLFPFNRSSVYLLLGPDAPQGEVKSITLRAKSADGPLQLTVPVQKSIDTGSSIHTLAARKAIQDLEEGRGWLQTAKITSSDNTSVLVKTKHAARFDELVEREAVRLGEEFQVAGKWTSFVAVQSHEDGTTVETPPLKEAATNEFLAGTLTGTLTGTFGSAASSRGRGGFQRMAFGGGGGRGGGGSSVFARSDMLRKRRVGVPAPSAPAYTQLSDSEEDEDNDDDMGFGLFDDGSSAPPVPPAAFGTLSAPAPAPARAAFASAALPPPPGKGGMLSALGKPITSFARSEAPAAKKKKKVAAPKADRMHQLIDLQKFSGSWEMSEDLKEVLEIGDGKLDLTFAQGNANLAATALAIAWLESSVGDKKGSWEMVADKARGWIAAQGGWNEAQVEALIVAAKTLLQVHL